MNDPGDVPWQAWPRQRPWARFCAALLVCCLPGPLCAAGDAIEGFVAAHCLACHDAQTKEGGLDLAALTTEIDDAGAFDAWVLVHDRVAAGQMPPADAEQPEQNARAEFVAELDERLRGASRASQQREGRAAARRLTREEYQNSLADLLATRNDYRALLPEDDKALGFDKVASSLAVSAEHLEAYLAVARTALDDCLVPAPPPAKTMRYPQRFADLGRMQMRTPYQYLDARDALVIFSDQWDSMTGFVAETPGRYRFRIRARAWQSAAPVKARIRAGRDSEPSRRLVTYTEFPAAGAEFEVTIALARRETLRIGAVGIAPRGLNANRHRVPLSEHRPAATYPGPGLAVEWIDVEGPLPASTFVDEYLAGVDLAAGTRDDAQRALAAFLPRAFRRPVGEDERGRFLAIYDAIEPEAGFVAALKGALQAVLCSPHFLYLQGPPGALDDHALAARLSYFLWNTTPDGALEALAAEGRLRDAEVLRGAVERMLEDPRSEAFVTSFTDQWLELAKIDDTTPDPLLYPEFDELLQWSSVEETRSFFKELLARDLSVLNFVRSDFAMLNDRLAAHYGISGVKGLALVKTALPPESVRGGLLGQASVLKVTANGTTSSPVLRGVWVMDRIVGRTPPPPPAAVPGLEPDIRGATTIREQLARHRSDPACAACHAQFDPAGFALENFDVIGGWRDRYRTSLVTAKATRTVQLPLYLDTQRLLADPKQRVACVAKVGVGLPVEAASEYEGQAFRNFNEFRQLLLADPDQIARSLLTKLVIYSTGTPLQYADRAELEELVVRVRARGYGLRAAIHELVQSPLFLNR